MLHAPHAVRTALVALFALSVLGACDESASTTPAPSVQDAPRAGAGMLPAGMTAGERQGKADGNDPRDGDPTFRFTASPGDVDVLPGEFEDTQLLLLAYSEGASDLLDFYVDLVSASYGHVTVVVFTDSDWSERQIARALDDAGVDLDALYLMRAPIDSIWIRDYGPLFTLTDDGAFHIVDFRYYWGRFQDDALPTVLGRSWDIPVARPPLDLEGGNLQSDGAGRCITTEWTVQANAIYGYRADDVRDVLADHVGCDQTVILPELEGEATGHVDMLATITGPGHVIVGDYPRAEDPENAARLDLAADRLVEAGFDVTRVPMPSNWDGAFRSYTNSLALNDVVLVPTYRDDTRFEAEALAAFERAYPSRTIVPVDSTEIIQWAGAVHCVTMTIAQ